MANLPDSLYEDYSRHTLSWPYASASAPAFPPLDICTILQWINELRSKIKLISDKALQNLANHRNAFEILPILIWNSPFTMSNLLQEVAKIYSRTTHPVYSQHEMPVRVYNILLLLQCIAHHPETRRHFLKAKMPYYVYPLIAMDLTNKPLECLRIGALGVIAHMLEPAVDGAAVHFLMDSGALHSCTIAAEIGSTESKTLAVFILNKVMSTNEGLQYCCVLADRFFVIDGLLKKMLVYLSSMVNPSSSLFNLVASCYAKLSRKSRARAALWYNHPVMLLDGTFASLLAKDPVADSYHIQLRQNLGI